MANTGSDEFILTTNLYINENKATILGSKNQKPEGKE